MSKEDRERKTTISKASTPEEIGDFWDTHSLDDYWEHTHEVELEVRVKRKRRITLDPELYTQVEAEARERGITPETLVNLWLAERLQKAG